MADTVSAKDHPGQRRGRQQGRKQKAIYARERPLYKKRISRAAMLAADLRLELVHGRRSAWCTCTREGL